MSVPAISHFQSAPLLSAEDERDLAQTIERGRAAAQRLSDGGGLDGDQHLVQDGAVAKQTFVESNIRLVLSTARSFRTPSHVDRNDVIQDGILGLERAVDRFDWRKGYKFSTYATWWIRQSMQRGFENTGSTIRIPAHRSSELRVALATAKAGVDELPEALRRVAAITTLDSIDRVTDDSQQSLTDSLASNDDGPDVMMERSIDRDAVLCLLDDLDPVTRQIVEQRFGFGQEPPQTYAALAVRFEMSHESVRRRVIKALTHLRPRATALAA